MVEYGEYEEPYVRLIREFLTGAEWLQNMTLYLNSHCMAFVQLEAEETRGEEKGREEKKHETFSHEQFQCFLTFQAWVDEILRTQLFTLGIDEAAFVEMLERKLQDQSTSQDLANQIHTVLDIVESIDTFENFANLMQSSYDRLVQDDMEQVALLETQLELKQWDLQVALARSLLDAHHEGTVLTDLDAGLLPWATAVLSLQSALERAGAPGADPAKEKEEITQLSEELLHERIKVEYLVADRLSEGIPSKADHAGNENEQADTTLGRLLSDSGKTQLAISQQRSFIHLDNAMLSDQQYEKVYFAVREELHKNSSKVDHAQLQQVLQQQIPSLFSRPWIIEKVADLIHLEEQLRRINRDIQQELNEPGSVQYKPLESHGGKASRNLRISTDHESTLRQIGAYLDNPNSRALPATPKEAREAILQMQDNLREISQQRELERLRKQMQEQALKSKADTSYLKNAHRLASQAARIEAMGYAQEGESYGIPIHNDQGYFAQHEKDNAGGVDDDAFSVGTEEEDENDEQEGGFESDGTEEDQAAESKQGGSPPTLARKRSVTGLKIRAYDSDSPQELLRETERLRKQLLLRATPTAFSGKGGAFVQLNSPKVGGKVGIKSPKTAKEYQLSLAPTQELTINPTSLRFLAGNLESAKGAPS